MAEKWACEKRQQLYLKAHEWGFLAIDSDANGMGYVIDPDDRNRILIATNAGRVIMTKNQALTFAREIGDIANMYMR